MAIGVWYWLFQLDGRTGTAQTELYSGLSVGYGSPGAGPAALKGFRRGSSDRVMLRGGLEDVLFVWLSTRPSDVSDRTQRHRAERELPGFV